MLIVRIAGITYRLAPGFIIVLLNPDLILFENTVHTDQMASDEAIWSVCTVFSTRT